MTRDLTAFLSCSVEVCDTRQRRFDTILSINMLYRYHTILPPSPKQTKISKNHCTMPKHTKFLFKKRIMFTFLGLMLLLLAATTSPALENNFSDGTNVPHVPGTPNYITWAKYRIGIARNQVSILHEEVSVSVVSIIVVSYRPALVVSLNELS